MEAQHSQTLSLSTLDIMTFIRSTSHSTPISSTICLSVSFTFNILNTKISLSPKDQTLIFSRVAVLSQTFPGSKGFGGENDDLLAAHFPFPVMSLSSSLKCPSPLKCRPSDSATTTSQSYLPTTCQSLHSLKTLHLAYSLAPSLHYSLSCFSAMITDVHSSTLDPVPQLHCQQSFLHLTG